MAVDLEIVIDASAAVCYLRRERGWEKFPEHIPGGVMSVVNYAEVVQRILREHSDAPARVQTLVDAGLRLIDADTSLALAAAELEQPTRSQGVSVADRFCLALGMTRNSPVLTADRPWKSLGLPVDIRLLR